MVLVKECLLLASIFLLGSYVSGRVIKSENLERGIPISKVKPAPSLANLCASKSGYKLYGNKYCYRVASDLVYWDFAYQACASEKTHLVIINNQDEFNTIRAFSSDLANYWVGATSTGNYDGTWINGETFTPLATSWIYPNYVNGTCIDFYKNDLGTDVLYTAGTNIFQDGCSSFNLTYICEYDL